MVANVVSLILEIRGGLFGAWAQSIMAVATPIYRELFPNLMTEISEWVWRAG